MTTTHTTRPALDGACALTDVDRTPATDHYKRLVTAALSVAAESRIRANGYVKDGTQGWASLHNLADQLYQTLNVATLCVCTEAELGDLCVAADTAAIQRISEGLDQ